MAAIQHPGASPSCLSCDGSGWRELPGAHYAYAPCSCLGPCPACGDRGFVRSERCACALGRERTHLLAAARLPRSPLDGPVPADLAAWASSYRPEDGWPWLLVGECSAGWAARTLADLVLSIGVAIETPDSPQPTGARILALLDVDRLPPARVIDWAEHCADRERTLVATTERPLYGAAGLEGALGDDAIVALLSGP